MEILLMRHAEAAWSTGLGDEQRPLNARGRADAAEMGRFLQAKGLLPDRILYSPAQRVLDTLEELRPSLGQSGQQLIEIDDLYLAPLQVLQDEIAKHQPGAKRLMLIAHNPGLSELVLKWAGNSPQVSMSAGVMVPAAVAHFLANERGMALQGIYRPDQV